VTAHAVTSGRREIVLRETLKLKNIVHRLARITPLERR